MFNVYESSVLRSSHTKQADADRQKQAFIDAGSNPGDLSLVQEN